VLQKKHAAESRKMAMGKTNTFTLPSCTASFTCSSFAYRLSEARAVACVCWA